MAYTGLPSHPQNDLASSQMRGSTGVLSLLAGNIDRARTIGENTRVFALTESLIVHPALMPHAPVPRGNREAMGITDGLVSRSVGIQYLIGDVEWVLAAI